jgi:hypothetical protein
MISKWRVKLVQCTLLTTVVQAFRRLTLTACIYCFPHRTSTLRTQNNPSPLSWNARSDLRSSMECRRTFMNAQSQLPQEITRMYVIYVHILRVFKLHIPRFEVLTAVLQRIWSCVARLVIPDVSKERTAFMFKGHVWTHVTSQKTWTFTFVLFSVNTNHARSEVLTAVLMKTEFFWNVTPCRLVKCFTICQLKRSNTGERKSLQQKIPWQRIKQ